MAGETPQQICCRYLRGGPCDCDPVVQTDYGPGTRACFGLSEELRRAMQAATVRDLLRLFESMPVLNAGNRVSAILRAYAHGQGIPADQVDRHG